MNSHIILLPRVGKIMCTSGLRLVKILGWRERNQQDATNPMFIMKRLSQHVSGIIMPIIRRTRLCITAYGVLHWLVLVGCGCVELRREPCALRESYLHTVHTAHDAAPHNHSQPIPAQLVQNTICGSTRSCSPDDGHNDARNMLR